MSPDQGAVILKKNWIYLPTRQQKVLEFQGNRKTVNYILDKKYIEYPTKD